MIHLSSLRTQSRTAICPLVRWSPYPGLDVDCLCVTAEPAFEPFPRGECRRLSQSWEERAAARLAGHEYSTSFEIWIGDE